MTDHEKHPDEKPLAGERAPTPSDRDEHPSAPTENDQHRHNRGVTEQGRRDLEAGIEDTERIGVPTSLPASGDRR